MAFKALMISSVDMRQILSVEISIFLKAAKLLLLHMKAIIGYLKIGNGVYINHYSIVDCHYSITIGNGVNIGPHCYIGDFDHNIKLATDNTTDVQFDGVALPVIIENNVWLGAGVVVLKGVTIGEGAIVGAGSVVTKDIPSNAIFVGNPARFIKSRSH